MAVCVILCTVPTKAHGRKLAQKLLHQKQVACVNLILGIESHYWWQDKLELSEEVLLIIKTTSRKAKAVTRLILQSHPYEVPEVLVLPVAAGNPTYLKWVAQSVGKN